MQVRGLGSLRTRDAEQPAVAVVDAARGAWYPDPYGKAGERWWDGHKWTAEVRGPAVIDVPARRPREAVVRRPAADAGAREQAAAVEEWKLRDARRRAERSAEEREAQRRDWVLTIGYIAAILLPVLGLVLGIVVVTRPSRRDTIRHGFAIIALSAVFFVVGILLVRHR